MQKKQVAVVEVGSSKITAVVCERGINNTFVIKASTSYEYDGFESGAFFNEKQLKGVLCSVAEFLKKSKNTIGGIQTVYVGVPGDFTKVVVKDSQISFPKKKKIQDEDVDALFDSAFVMSNAKYTLINRSAIVYELDDFRRMANPVGATSEILKGKLSFVVCSNYFIEAVKNTLVVNGIERVECVSLALAQAMYLVDAEVRDRIAILVNVGYISTTLSVIQGDGILFQKSFAYGGGYVTASIMEKFDMDFDCAERLKRKINLSQICSSASYDLIEADNGEYYNVEELKSIIKSSLDVLCENVSVALEEFGYVIPEYVPLSVTGGGIAYIRGAKEHVSGRLNMAIEIIAPKVPLMDKPTESALLSLLDLALEQN